MSKIHPEMQNFITLFGQVLAGSGLSGLRHDDPSIPRAALAALSMPEEMLPPIHSVEDRTIPGSGHEIPIRIYRPSDEAGLPVLMWFHGGGWVLGDLDGGNLNCRKFANEANCVVISVDYRLAPETAFPGPLDDCLAATVWVAASAAQLSIDADRIAVAGDSAGGNLAACVAYRARDEGPKLVAQILIYPVTDADFERASYLENATDKLLTRDDMIWFWDCYVPNTNDRTNPAVAPIHATDLSGLPPAHVLTAEFDPLRDEGEAYGAALKAAGVPTETIRYNGMIHGFFNFGAEPPIKEVVDATAGATAALIKAFAK